MSRLDKLYLGTNTKMYKTISQTKEFVRSLERLTGDMSEEETSLFVIPSFPSVGPAKQCLSSGRIRIGAQNMGWEEEGPFSGEVSAPMLKELGADLVMIGHSERRHELRETDRMENGKVLCALRNGITPLLCIGETGEQKDYKISDECLSIQLKTGLSQVSAEEAEKIWIAYEPVWAIGAKGTPADPEYVRRRHSTIRHTLEALFGETPGREIPILYGGSVNIDNAVSIIREENVDGLFIGRSAWEADSFNRIIRDVLPVWREKQRA